MRMESTTSTRCIGIGMCVNDLMQSERNCGN
jgi:hypothetical protein